jgi:hypothetical protein
MPPFSKDVGESALAEQIVRALGGQWCGDYGTACCPAHQDRKPSLSVTEKNGNVLFYCHAGCTQLKVIGALRSLGLSTSATRIGTRSKSVPMAGRLFKIHLFDFADFPACCLCRCRKEDH